MTDEEKSIYEDFMEDPNREMSFGKYEGQPIGSVPAQYLVWLYHNFNFSAGHTWWVQRYIKENYEELKKIK